MHKTSAWPLALVYAALIVYASLFPFADWRDQGIAPWAYIRAPLPQYWSGFDVVANVLGYAPLGFLLVLGAARSGGHRHAVGVGTLTCGALSFCLETLQSYLPTRVASNVDLSLNVLGAWAGTACAATLERWGAIDRWGGFRQRWFAPDARWALVLLALWPLALLFPASVPFGLGQVWERADPVVRGLLTWMSVPVDQPTVWQPMRATSELLCVSLGMLAPCLLGYCVIPSVSRRLLFLLPTLGLGVAMTALSSALSFGPTHAWVWLSPTINAAGSATLLTALLALMLPARACAVGLFVALVLQLCLLNQTPVGAYFSQTQQTWEQGKFIRFHGLAQWLGWLWPYATLLYVLRRATKA